MALGLAATPVGAASGGDASAATTSGDGDAAAATSSGDGAEATTQPRTPADVRPAVDVLTHPLGPVADGAPVDPQVLTRRLTAEMSSHWLGPREHRAITVRDALTGEHLYDREADREVTPASTTKLLSAAAIVSALDPGTTFTTRVVQGARPEEVVLVAGGDMLLADGRGDVEQVAGHAGLADLAAQTARSLRAAGVQGPVSVRLDLSYLRGPAVLDTWSADLVAGGFTGRVVQLGRSVDRAIPGYAAPAQPEQQAARVFRDALTKAGVKVRGRDTPAAEVRARAGAPELAAVTSAPLRDVLALALSTSDNAMLEQLARAAAHAAGQPVDRRSVARWIVAQVGQAYGIDTTGVVLADASGLSDGTRIPVRAVADVLVAGSDGSHPRLQSTLAARGLPIAGYTGTLATRFHLPVHAPAVGDARAKTGTLPGVSSLAGTVVTADGRELVFAMTVDRIQPGSATIEARSVQDEIVAELARCGCGG